MPMDEFLVLVQDAVDEVPEPFASALAEVALVVEERSPVEDPNLYGLYTGVPLTLGFAEPGPPPHIAIYRIPLADHYPDPAELRREVRITVMHELGHHLGMDEDQLDRLGYG